MHVYCYLSPKLLLCSIKPILTVIQSLQRVSIASRWGEMLLWTPTEGKLSWAAAAGDTAHSSRPCSSGSTTFSGCGPKSMCPAQLDRATITFSRITYGNKKYRKTFQMCFHIMCVILLVGQSICNYFLEGRKLHFHMYELVYLNE